MTSGGKPENLLSPILFGQLPQSIISLIKSFLILYLYYTKAGSICQDKSALFCIYFCCHYHHDIKCQDKNAESIILCLKYYFRLRGPLSDYMGYIMTIFLTWMVGSLGLAPSGSQWHQIYSLARYSLRSTSPYVVELTRIELATLSVQGRYSTKWATAPKIEKPINVLIPVYTNRPLLSSRWKITILLPLNLHHNHICYQLCIHRVHKYNFHIYNFHYRILTQLPPFNSD